MKRIAAAAVLAVLLAGCGLPLPRGVEVPGEVAGGQQQPGDIQVLPPAPRDDATAEQEVRDFFGAQSNPEDRHAGARAFLATRLQREWDDTGAVRVYAGDLGIVADVRPGVFRITAAVVGRIGADGSYSAERVRYSELVHVTRTARGRWVLTSAPSGLLLSVADRDRSFLPRSTYFLAPPVGRPPAPTHLVPDPIFIPVTADPADALVRRLLAGPSTALGSSVSTAFPLRTHLLRPVDTAASGVVTVELSREADGASAVRREQMSAQLVWTLRQIPAFSKLRLRTGGHDVGVGSSGGQDRLQDRGSWPGYDPDGLPSRPPAYYVAARALHALDERTPDRPVAPVNRPPVDVAAVSPDGRQLAVITRAARGAQLATGPIDGALTLRTKARALSFPTWGSAEQGLWFLAGSHVMLAPAGARPREIPVEGVAGLAPITGLRVSRDGVRVALLTGAGAGRRLVVGRVSFVEDQPQIVALHAIAPEVDSVRDLAWDSATSLVVLGRFAGVTVPIRVAVDGSSAAPVVGIGLELATPIAIAAAPGRPLVIGATDIDGGRTLFREAGRQYKPETRGYGPFYPG